MIEAKKGREAGCRCPIVPAGGPGIDGQRLRTKEIGAILGDTAYYKLSTIIANSIRTLLRRSRLEMGDTLAVYFAHRFTEREIADELTAAGFKPVLFRTSPYAHAVGIGV